MSTYEIMCGAAGRASDAGRHVWRIWVVAITLLLSANTNLAQTGEEQRVLKLSRDKFRWLTSGATDSLQAILDPRMQYVHSNGWVQNREEMIADLASGKLVYEAIVVKTATVRLYKRSAVVTGQGTFTVRMNGSPLVIDLGFTEVYVREGNRWLLASRHANRMNP